MTDFINVNKGSTIPLDVAFGIDLTGVTVSVVDAYPAVLGAADVAVTDAAAGAVTVTWTDEQCDQLLFGKQNRFRLQLAFADGSEQTSNVIWIIVR